MSEEGARGVSVMPLTARQRDVLAIIVKFYEATAEPPSVLYVARRLSLSRAAVREHLEALYRKGWLRIPAPSGIQCFHVPSEYR